MKSRTQRCHELIRRFGRVCSPHGTRVPAPKVEHKGINPRVKEAQQDAEKVKKVAK